MTYKKLIDGFHLFQKDYFESEKKEEYKDLVEQGQTPETLIIACSDSRIDPAILTHSDPGEFFAVRNVAALVPPYNNGGQLRGTTSAIEYAVRHLEVKHIVILGHAGCGGINALATGNYQATSNHNFQFLHHWLNIGSEAKEKVHALLNDMPEQQKIKALEQVSILVSMENLLSFPWIKSKHSGGDIQIHGWYFDMTAGELLEYSEKDMLFEKINPRKTSTDSSKNKPDLDTFLKNYKQLYACSCGS